MSNPIVEAINAMAPAEKRGAIRILDMVTRPMTAREIEEELREHGASNKQATFLASKLKRMHVVALIGGEDG